MIRQTRHHSDSLIRLRTISAYAFFSRNSFALWGPRPDNSKSISSKLIRHRCVMETLRYSTSMLPPVPYVLSSFLPPQTLFNPPCFRKTSKTICLLTEMNRVCALIGSGIISTAIISQASVICHLSVWITSLLVSSVTYPPSRLDPLLHIQHATT